MQAPRGLGREETCGHHLHRGAARAGAARARRSPAARSCLTWPPPTRRGVPRELYQWGFDLGLHMVEIPEQFGGMGLTYETCAMMFEEL
ncbi:MAG: acyl-CoA dehydrogenase family protein [Adlercreutzia equolifaciens]